MAADGSIAGMTLEFVLDRATGELRDAQGRRFDAATRTWDSATAQADAAGGRVGLCEAVTWLNRESGRPLRVPVGVIGPREATPAQLAAATRVGRLLAECGLVVVCGGRQGVMHAVCRGVAEAGGLSVGLLPGTDAGEANEFVGIAIATGIGEARNALIARASFALVCIGNSYGTLSEVALGRHFGKLVIGIEGAPDVDGVIHAASPDDAVARVLAAVMNV
jgi:uncharacterized protein (TIGR00725 family)